jgi:hypothetical protein
MGKKSKLAYKANLRHGEGNSSTMTNPMKSNLTNAIRYVV